MTSSAPSITARIPYFRIQHDWEISVRDALKNQENKFWVTYQTQDAKHHDELELSNKTLNFSSERYTVDGFATSGRWIQITEKKDSFSTKFYSPNTSFVVHNKKRINCMELSAGGSFGISGSDDGQVRIWDTEDGHSRRDLVGHVGDVYVTKILPSSQVAMTSAGDLLINIWRISDGLCAATLKGHKSFLTNIEFLDRGRNFISSSNDGTVKLWDCSSQTCITTLTSFENSTAVTDCHVLSTQGAAAEKYLDSREAGTENKLALCCTNQKGFIRLVDVHSRKVASETSAGVELTRCRFINEKQFVCSTGNGNLIHYDLRNTATCLSNVSLGSESPVLSMQAFNSHAVLAGTQDGSCFVFDFQKATRSAVPYQFTGADCDPIYAVAFANTSPATVYSACRDGKVRKYSLI